MKRFLANTLRRPSLLALLSVLVFSASAMAGTLSPSASPAATMRTLAEIYNAIAGTFDSSAITANQNGSLLETLKYLENQVPWASSSNNIWNLNSGNVGIGTSSLDAKFEVSGVASVSSLLIGGSAPRLVTSNSLDFDEFAASMTLDSDTTISNNGYALTLGNASVSGSFEVGSGGFWTDGTNVGVGTASPSTLLVVSGALTGTNGKGIQLLDSTASSGSLKFMDGTNFGGAFSPYIEARAVGTGTTRTGLQMSAFLADDDTDDMGMLFDVYSSKSVALSNAAAYSFRSAFSELMRINANGGVSVSGNFELGSNGFFWNGTNVGIGTSRPDAKLEVVGTASVSGSGYFGGNVGIGALPSSVNQLLVSTTAGATYSQVEIAGTYTLPGDNDPSAVRVTSTIAPGANTGRSAYGIWAAPTLNEASSGVHPLFATMRLDAPTISAGSATMTNAATLYVSGAPSATVTGGNYALYSAGGTNYFNGNVGIGTTSVDAKLEVAGTASISNSLYVVSGGNVGIGTSTPGASLELLKTQDGVNSELIKLQNNGSGANTGTSIGLYLGGTLAGQIAGNYVGGFQMQLQSGTTSLDIDSSGPVHVTNTGANNAQMYIGTSAALAVGNTAEVIFGPGTGFSATLGPRVYGYLESISEAGLRFDTYNSGRSTRMVITGAGNVGIGATTPEQKLTVVGNILASSSGNVDFILRSSTTNGATNNDDSQFTLRTGSASERFDIINGVGAKLFSIASAGNVGIGTTSPRAQVDVAGALPVLVASKSTSTDNASGTGTNDSLYVQGRYLYTVNLSAGNMEIYDVSNPSTPTLVSTTSSGAGSGSIHVQGNYAYIGIECGNVIIYDVSNPANPVRMGDVAVNGCTEALQAQGRYVYTHGILGNGYTNIVDVSNPSAPTLVSSYNNLNNDSRVTMFGKYLFGAENIFDVSNPASMSRIFNSTTGGFGDITPQGRYAYGVLGTTFRVYDISNIASPSTVGTLSGFTNGGRLPAIQGRYAYVVSPNSGGASTLYTVDISTPTAPRLVSTVSTLGVTASKPIVQGRYLYVKNRNSSSFHIYDLGGGYVQQIETGSIESSGLSVRGGARIGQDLELGGALSVGRTSLFSSGLAVTGNLSVVGSRGNFDAFNVASASGTSLFRISKSGFVGINDSTPSTTLDVAGSASVSGNFELTGASSKLGINAGGLINTTLEVGGTASISGIAYFGGNIGIGTTSVDAKLEVAGTASISNSLYVISGGNVGIGTSAPTTKLHLSVNDATTNAITDILHLQHLTTGTAANSIGAGILFSSEDTTGTAEDVGRISGIFSNATHGAEAGALTFATRNTAGIFERMRIASDGTVGIGTTVTGTAGLAVRTTAVDGLSIIASGNAGGGTGYGFYLEKSGTGGTNYGIYASISGATTNRAAFFKTTNSDTTSVTEILSLVHDSNVAGGNGNGASLVFYGEDTIGSTEEAGSIAGLLTNATHGAEVGAIVLTPRGSGNVGIGTSTPKGKLTVAGASAEIIASGSAYPALVINATNATNGTQGLFKIQAQSTEESLRFLNGAGSYLMTIASAGNVGIGSSAPTARLSLGTSAGAAALHIYQGGVGSNYGMGIQFSNNYQFFTSNGTFFTFNGGGNLQTVGAYEMMRVSASGVGIGVTSPAARLDVKGSQSTDPFNVASASGTSILRVSKGGNVGINDSTPTTTLDVAGSASISGSFEVGTSGFWTNGTNVGIGNNRPDQKLDVAGNITASTSGNVDIIIRSSTPTDDGGKFTIRSAGASDRLDIFGALPDGVNAAYTPRFSIASSGFVGVYGRNYGPSNPSTPAALFEVLSQGGAAPVPTTLVSFSGTLQDPTAIGLNVSANAQVGGTIVRIQDSSPAGGQPDGKLLEVFGDAENDGNSSDLNRMFSVFNGGGGSGGRPSVYMYGNVGIGILSTTAARLDVRSSVSGNYDLLNVASSSGTSYLRVTKGGNVGIGTTTPTSKLQIVGGDCADDAGGGGCTADYAEFYPSTEDMQKGDLVMIDVATTSYAVKKATSAGVAIGIVSTNPAITIDGGSLSLFSNAYVLNPRKPAIALKGRVPLKVIGTIAPGDWLAASDTPGYAQKATTPGMVVGVALEASQDGKVLTFVSPTWWSPTTQGESLVSIDAPTMSSIFSAMIQMFADVLHITFTDGLVKMRSVELETGATIKDKATGQPYCVQVEYGQLVTTSGPCGSGATSIPTPEPIPDVTPTPTPEVTPTPTPESTPEITLEGTQAPTPTPIPEVAPTPVPEPTPEVTPEPVL